LELPLRRVATLLAVWALLALASVALWKFGPSYRDCLGGELKIMTVGESAMASQMPPNTKDMVMHSTLQKDGFVLMASDNMGTQKVVKGNTISLSLMGASKEEIQPYFSKLSEGAKAVRPLEQAFFGWYGELTDKFGIRWMFEADNPKP
jgi:PhnB protein